MRVPSIGQQLYERRIVREGKRIAERMLAGFDVTANGRFIAKQAETGPLTRLLATAGIPRRAGRVYK